MRSRLRIIVSLMAAGMLLWSMQCVSSSAQSSGTGEPTVGESINTRDTDSNRMKITFVNPGISDPKDPTGGFWLSVSSFMKAAAKQLDIDLEIIYSERDHILMRQQALQVASRPVLPDYLIVVNEKLAADGMVEAADRVGLKVFVMLNSFVGDQARQMGAPREKHPNWIGSLVPDNAAAGSLIAKHIIHEAMAKGAAPNGRLRLFAIAGDPVTPAAVQRVEGLKKTVSQYPNVELQQVFMGEWRQDIACQQTQIALLRYPETGAIWAANDPMALGAIEGSIQAKRQPGKDIFIGGLNWDAPALAQVKDGALTVSVGGHFMTGGWSLVMLYDYHRGKDFADEGVELQRPIFGVLDRSNIDAFLSKFGDRDWNKVDFRRFSKVLNPNLATYDFNAEAVLDQ